MILLRASAKTPALVIFVMKARQKLEFCVDSGLSLSRASGKELTSSLFSEVVIA